MQKMGYVFGTGLGLRSEGRVEPVPVVVYPSGKSLDWISDHKNECEAFTLRKTMKKSEESPRHQEKSKSGMFDLLNVACSSRSVPSSKASTASLSSSPLNVQGLNNDLAMAKMRQEVLRLKESASRHTKDQATFNSIQSRLQATQSKLKAMEKKSSSMDKDKNLARERERLTKF